MTNGQLALSAGIARFLVLLPSAKTPLAFLRGGPVRNIHLDRCLAVMVERGASHRTHCQVPDTDSAGCKYRVHALRRIPAQGKPLPTSVHSFAACLSSPPALLLSIVHAK